MPPKRHLYYNRDGTPFEGDVVAFAKMLETADRVVARDEFGDILVSTVFLGINHNWGPGKPTIFETMVFGGSMNEECRRYSTEAEAKAGHQAVVALVREHGLHA